MTVFLQSLFLHLTLFWIILLWGIFCFGFADEKVEWYLSGGLTSRISLQEGHSRTAISYPQYRYMLISIIKFNVSKGFSPNALQKSINSSSQFIFLTIWISITPYFACVMPSDFFQLILKPIFYLILILRLFETFLKIRILDIVFLGIFLL